MALTGWSVMAANTLWAADDIPLTTPVSGVVEKVFVKPGQRVSKGTLLLQLDKTILQARLDEAVAEQARAQAEEGDAKRDLDRAQELFDRTVSSLTELDAAALRHARAQAVLSTAGARRGLRKELAGCRAKAPFTRWSRRFLACRYRGDCGMPARHWSSSVLAP
jgi:multidrug efflux pump subunit AcrA (membrane-fusion protein)